MRVSRKPRATRPASRLFTSVLATGAAVVGFWPLSAAYGQTGNAPPGEPGAVFAPGAYLSSREFVIAAAILVFGVVMTSLATWLFFRSKVPADQIIRLFALMLIVTGTLFLVASGYSATSIAPSMGLLGTIAGYLLGRGANQRTPADAATPPGG